MNNKEVQTINVEDIIPNRFQPRKNFDEDSLNELADSIRQHGIIQPLVLRKLNDKFEIIAGERRFKAATIIGLKSVPAIVMEIDDVSSAEIALVENIQRKDLTAIEEAKSYEKILEIGQMNQDELAKRVGRTQSTVSNKLRLLNLSDESQQALLDGKISERHARSLLRLKDKDVQNEMLNKIIDNRLTVRETDLEIKQILGNNNQQEEDKIEEIIDFQFDTPIVNNENNTTPLVEEQITTNQEGEQNMNPNDVNNQNNNVFINPQINEEQPKQPINEFANQINNIPEFDQGLNEQVSVFGGIPTNQPPQNNNMENQIPTGPMGGKFFNNLDDEAANMNMGNTFDSSSQSFNPEQFGNPNINEHQINPNNSFPEPPMFTQPPQPTYENNTQPMTSPQPFIAQQDITGAVAVIRNTIVNLQNNGYVINTNEQDMGNTHQIIINIQK